MSTASVSCWHVYVISLWNASLDFVLEAPVWGRATRRSGTTCNLVSMHTDDVAAISQGLLREKWSLRQMETSDAHGTGRRRWTSTWALKNTPTSHLSSRYLRR